MNFYNSLVIIFKKMNKIEYNLITNKAINIRKGSFVYCFIFVIFCSFVMYCVSFEYNKSGQNCEIDNNWHFVENVSIIGINSMLNI